MSVKPRNVYVCAACDGVDTVSIVDAGEVDNVVSFAAVVVVVVDDDDDDDDDDAVDDEDVVDDDVDEEDVGDEEDVVDGDVDEEDVVDVGTGVGVGYGVGSAVVVVVVVVIVIVIVVVVVGNVHALQSVKLRTHTLERAQPTPKPRGVGIAEALKANVCAISTVSSCRTTMLAFVAATVSVTCIHADVCDVVEKTTGGPPRAYSHVGLQPPRQSIRPQRLCSPASRCVTTVKLSATNAVAAYTSSTPASN